VNGDGKNGFVYWRSNGPGGCYLSQ
jgi:hypothetical protein